MNVVLAVETSAKKTYWIELWEPSNNPCINVFLLRDKIYFNNANELCRKVYTKGDIINVGFSTCQREHPVGRPYPDDLLEVVDFRENGLSISIDVSVKVASLKYLNIKG